ncbi:MAG: PAS domain-containing protein [Chloroflexi bacterium]|nr:PAS domain-containing protein [Chloroflexota bacterium]
MLEPNTLPKDRGQDEDLQGYLEDLEQFLPQPFFYVNQSGTIVTVSRTLAESTGYRADELVGQPVGMLFDGKEEVRQVEAETLRTGEVRARRMTLLTKDKREVPVSFSAFRRKNKDGNTAGYLATFTEVTDRQAQLRIEQAAREWRATMDAIQDLVWISDKDCRLLRVNRAFASVTGMEPKQIIGQDCRVVFTWAKEACARCPHKYTIAHKEPATEEFYNTQRQAHLEISTSPILNERGEVIASVCIARDITHRKHAEREIQALNRLRQYFSPKLAQRLISEEDLFKVRRKNLTVFFVDIRGFTMMSDETEPEELLNMLNEFFTQMTQVIFQWGGTVGKFIGDGIMGFFGDPDEQPNHAELAIRMALDMQSRVKMMNEKSPLWTEFPLAIGIGINTGYVTVGNIGPENHRDYTIIGRHVNLASRLEAEAKAGQILISQRTYRLVANLVRAEEIGAFNVKGFDKPVQVYSILGMA